MKQCYTQAKKARRFNNWGAYQKAWASTSVFMRRVQGFFGADHAAYDRKHPDLEHAVDGYKSRLAAQQINYAQQRG